MYKSHITSWGFFKNVEKAQKHCVDTYQTALQAYGVEDARTAGALNNLVRFCKLHRVRLSSILPRSTRVMSIDRWEHLKMLERQYMLDPNDVGTIEEDDQEEP